METVNEVIVSGNIQVQQTTLSGNIIPSQKTLTGSIRTSSATSTRWGTITGDINNQEDLMDELDVKYDSENFTQVTNSQIEAMFR